MNDLIFYSNLLSKLIILRQPVAKNEAPIELSLMTRLIPQIPWGHNILLLEKIKDAQISLWYMQKLNPSGAGMSLSTRRKAVNNITAMLAEQFAKGSAIPAKCLSSVKGALLWV